MSKGSGHTKVVKRSFNKQLMRCLGEYRKQLGLSASRVSAATGIAEIKLKRAEITGNILAFDMAKLLYFYRKWFTVSLIDEQPIREQAVVLLNQKRETGED